MISDLLHKPDYVLSGGATILTLMLAGAKAVISLVNLTSMPGNIVVPPLNTLLCINHA